MSDLPNNGSTFEPRRCRLAVARLTRMELRVLLLIAECKMNKEIADELGVSPATVEFHNRNIFRELGVVSRTQALRVALAAGAVK